MIDSDSLRELLLSRRPELGPRPTGRAVALALISLAVSLLTIPDLLPAYPRLGPDSHMRASLGHAINGAFCRSPKLSNVFDIPSEVTARPDELFWPLPRVIERCCVSIDAYCSTLRIARIDNEYSLMWLMRAILAVNPRASIAGIGQALALVRIAMLAVCCVALSRAGASLLTTIGVAVITAGILRNLRIYQYHYVPFILMLPLFLIGVYILLLGQRALIPWKFMSALVTAAIFAGLGLLTAFSANMRTSHAPIYLGLFLLFFLAWRKGASVRLQVATLSAFAIGSLAGQRTLIKPMAIPGAEGYAHHMVMHPLVLGLSLPENALSRREGLKWDDPYGEEVARRIDPAATYLSERYEPALARYYLGLWRQYPREMAGIYLAKFQAAGAGVFEDAAHLVEHRGLPPSAGEWLSRRSVPGTLLLALTAILGIVSWRLYRLAGSLPSFAWALLSAAAVGTLVESAMIMPRFQIVYHSVLLVYLLLTPLFVVQLAADLLASKLGGQPDSRRGSADRRL